MSEKRYQISPIELARWAEPLFGEDEKPAEGFSEELIAAYEASAGFRIPAAFRDYLLACGQAGLNDILHHMGVPDQAAKPFGNHLTFSHDFIEDEMQDYRKRDEAGNEEQERVWALPKERWDEQVENYLLFWWENQGCWHAGIRKQDLDQPNPPVYFNDEDTMYHWAIFSDSIQSFLIAMLLEAAREAGAEVRTTEDPEVMRAFLEKNGVDFARLQEPYPFPGGRFAHTCLDAENDRLYVYGEAGEGRKAYLSVFMPWSEELEGEDVFSWVV